MASDLPNKTIMKSRMMKSKPIRLYTTGKYQAWSLYNGFHERRGVRRSYFPT